MLRMLFVAVCSIWHVGNVDVCQGTVTMRFRITLFWNDASSRGGVTPSAATHSRATASTSADPQPHPDAPTTDGGWIMHGRQRACRHALHSETTILETIPVPPVSILNAVTFDVLGDPEVTLLDPSTRLFRWSCMYNATLFQGDHMRVDAFPHDAHQLKLKLGVLAHRGKGSVWDRAVYAFGLATADDSQGSTKIPHGLVVDHVTVRGYK